MRSCVLWRGMHYRGQPQVASSDWTKIADCRKNQGCGIAKGVLVMDFWGSISGTVRLILTSADLTGALERMEKQRVPVLDCDYIDSLHIEFTIRKKDLSKVLALAEKRGDMAEILHQRGLFFVFRSLAKRPVLIFGVLAILIFSCWLPSRVLFVCVEGNALVPARQILEEAELCGIGFLASRMEVRSEKMKNALLEAMPQLQWAGINTYGCTAVISVKERNDLQREPQTAGITNVIAVRDGIIRDMTVLQGTALCHSGQAVKEDQILVSGYTDCGIYIKGGQAKAEIYGDTMRELSAVLPVNYSGRCTPLTSEKKISLIIGKKRINLFKGSGISGSTCAKIYEEKYLTLPGGFVLPIAIARETWFEYETQPLKVDSEDCNFSQWAAWYLQEQMIAGKISIADQVYSQTESFCRLDGIYRCYELIGITREEERITGYEQDNRTND